MTCALRAGGAIRREELEAREGRARPLREVERAPGTARVQAHELRVRARALVDASGRVHRSLAVFCPRRRRSIGSSDCSACASLASGREDGTIRCLFEPPRSAEAAIEGDSIASLAMRLRVGAAMDGTTCVHVDAPIASLGSFDARGPAVVVGSSHAPVGLLRDVSSLRASSLAVHARAGDLAVPVSTIAEWEPLANALDRMISDRERVICTIGEGDRVVGLLTDVGALRFLSERRRKLAMHECT